EDTTVVTDEGDVPISQIQIGDFVLAWNQETNEITFERVTDTIHHTDEIAVYLTIDGEEIETTPEHPFYVEGAGWTEAEDLHRVDTVSPIAQFTSHSNGEAVQWTVLMTGNWHDETSGIGGGEISTDGGGRWQSGLIKNETDWEYIWQSNEVPNGEYFLLVRAIDQAGNIGEPDVVSLVVNNAPPSISITERWWVWEKVY